MGAKLKWKSKTIWTISSSEASRLIEVREKTGRFIVLTPSAAVGIDNLTGDAWTEEFDNIKTALNWLVGYEIDHKEDGNDSK